MDALVAYLNDDLNELRPPQVATARKPLFASTSALIPPAIRSSVEHECKKAFEGDGL